ncbi:MAG: DUF1127 domain-containing protein [Rhodospirillum sp.]|nr:DUF1127 domain-containing protein [Rhodospirillum sp.]MCF8490864.1 DUF1127 domain-containing protein [Rhodospirillum sp.]MCF8500100.1 DUF1127 domain-containing protein [Rhodospirillum sp.]
MSACPPLGARLLGWLRRAFLDWPERHRQRRHLRELDDRALQDLGLDRRAVDTEVDKPFWR